MLKQQILEGLTKAVKGLGFPTTDIVVSIPQNSNFGDYSTNLALQLAKLKEGKSKRSPMEIAKEIVTRVKSLESSKKHLEKAEVAGGGFINFFIKDESLISSIENWDKDIKSEKPQNVLIEYGHTNPLKEVHIGHLRTFILGESLARILSFLGHKVFRANYQGDIGLHIAKAIWGMRKLGIPTASLSLEEKAEFMGRSYAQGNTAYDQDQSVKNEIDEINASLYKQDPEFKESYQLARGWSLEYFQPIYELLDITYDRCFFESEVYNRGKEIVLDNLDRIFEKSDGAIIFPGEKYGLHNRVFVTSAGNPTYEGKEIGLAEAEYSSFNYEKAVHVVAAEQAGYFKVVFKAIEMVFPYLKEKKFHLSYGLVDLKEGKMSSRTGSVITVDDLYKVVSEKVREVMKQSRGEIDQKIVKQVSLGAIKFAYLKFSPAPNMVFDLEESVSLEGDSGPYIQYTYARIQSVLRKANRGTEVNLKFKLEAQERAILRILLYFQEIVMQAAKQYRPNLLASYLVELAREYNLFYQGNRIIDSEKEGFRLKLSEQTGEVLKKGLYLLGIEAPERM